MIDFGELPVFSATIYPAVLVMRKLIPVSDHEIQALTVNDISEVNHLTDVVRDRAWMQSQVSLLPSGWSLVRANVLALLGKLRGRGRPLGEYVKGKFYYGIKTGLNEAFIVDQSTRDWLISKNRRSAEIIKPWLRGRDIHRWSVEWAGLYVLFTRRGVDIDRYPAVKDYLAQFKKRLMPGGPGGRKPGSYQWYEIQDAVDYYNEFAQPKIIWRAVAEEAQGFGYDASGLLGADTTYFLPTSDLFLLAILNSPVAALILNGLCDRVQANYLRVKSIYIEQIPIPTPTPSQRVTAETIVRKLLETKGQGAQVTEWETELNALVYEAYGLTAAEITLIEESLI